MKFDDLEILLSTVILIIFLITLKCNRRSSTPAPAPGMPAPAPGMPAPAPGMPAPAPGMPAPAPAPVTDYCSGSELSLPPTGFVRAYMFENPTTDPCTGPITTHTFPEYYKTNGFTDCETNGSSSYECLHNNVMNQYKCEVPNCTSLCSWEGGHEFNKCINNTIFCSGLGTPQAPQCTPYPPSPAPAPGMPAPAPAPGMPAPAPGMPAPAPGMPAPAPVTNYCSGSELPLPPTGIVRIYNFPDSVYSPCSGSYSITDSPFPFTDGFADCLPQTNTDSMYYCLTDNILGYFNCDSTNNCGSPCSLLGDDQELNKCNIRNRVYCTGTGTPQAPQCTPYPPGRRPGPPPAPAPASTFCNQVSSPPNALDMYVFDNTICETPFTTHQVIPLPPMPKGKSECLPNSNYQCIGNSPVTWGQYECNDTSPCASPCSVKDGTQLYPLNICTSISPTQSGIMCNSNTAAPSCVPFVQPFSCDQVTPPPSNTITAYNFSDPACTSSFTEENFPYPFINGKTTCDNLGHYHCISGSPETFKFYYDCQSVACASPCSIGTFPINTCSDIDGTPTVVCNAPGNVAPSCVPFA